MKYKKILTWACTAALFLTGCTTDTASNGRWMEDSNAVRIQASAGSTLTRSNPIATDEKQTGFNQGDMISVRNRNITVNYTFDGEKLWVPENDKYLVWDEKDLKFEAYYPYDGKNDFSVGYIKKDQSTLDALAQSDYMRITSNNLQSIPSDKRLPLELKRQTARLIFKIDKFNDEFNKGVYVHKFEIACPENTNGGGSKEPIFPYKQDGEGGEGGVGTTYTALVIPGKRRVVITLFNPGKSTSECELETGELEAGKSYTYNLIVGKNKVTVRGVTVAEWNTGTPLPEGVAEEDLTPYVTMTANTKQTFIMMRAGSYMLPENLEYSVKNGIWQKVVADNPVVFGGEHGSLRLRGKCPNGTATNENNYSTITFSDPTVKVECSGDIRTLIDYTAYENAVTGNCRFCSLFKGCSVLTSAPELRATALKIRCYNSMFEGCTSLTKAPDLPATELQQRCYESMFEGCKSLTKAPDLPAPKLELGCYEAMFRGCEALTDAPKLSAEDLAWDCYRNMFESCKALDKAPALPATTLKPGCYSYMFANCTALTEAPELNATTIIDNAYISMFEGCTSLVKAPDLPGTILHNNCYKSMFSGCTSLKTAPVLGASTLYESCYKMMFYNCSNLESVTILGTFRNSNNLDNWLDGAGTNAENRTLKVSSKDFYDSKMKEKNSVEWQIPKCTVLDINDNEIK